MAEPIIGSDPSIAALLDTHPFLTLDSTEGLLFDGISLNMLAQKVGTPVWVLSASLFKERFLRLKKAIEQTNLHIHIHYAMKANDHLAVLDQVRQLGGGVDIVSGGELQKALKAGILPEQIIFSGVGKSNTELQAALTHGIGQINIESAEELSMLASLAQNGSHPVRVTLRVNPDIDAKTHAKITTGLAENKFGIPYDQALSLYRYASTLPNIRPIGFACHIGSQITTAAPFQEAFQRMAILIETARNEGLEVKTMDCGGGLGISYRTEKEGSPDILIQTIQNCFGHLDLTIRIEPGRWLAGPCGILLSTIIRSKKTNQAPFLVLDAAMNDLARPSLYEAWHGIIPLMPKAFHAPTHLAHVVGPVCETGDTFAMNRPLPELSAGQVVAILDTGAYGMVMSSTYNARPLAAQVMIEGGQWHVITERAPLSSLWERETIPTWSKGDG